jgi:hypothetical protein
MLNFINYEIKPQFSEIEEPIVVCFKFESEIEGEISIFANIIIDVVYKKINHKLENFKFQVVKGNNDIEFKVNIYNISLIH